MYFSECNEINLKSKFCLPKQTEVSSRQRSHLIHLSYSLSHMLNKYFPIARHFHQACIFIKYFSVTFMDYHSLYASKEETPFPRTSGGDQWRKMTDYDLCMLSPCYVFLDGAQAENQKQNSFGLTLSGFYTDSIFDKLWRNEA